MENLECMYVKHVKQIKGTSIGKAIVTLTGIEGAERDERQEKLRRILQSLITYINQHPSQHIWENAEVTLYDCEYNIVKICSGSEINKFIVNENFDGNITIKYVVNNKEKVFPDERSFLGFLGQYIPNFNPFCGKRKITITNMTEL